VTAALLIPDAERSLREDEKAAIDQGLAEADAGELIDLEEVEREFGIA
jgi:predicted transcriptional regulator